LQYFCLYRHEINIEILQVGHLPSVCNSLSVMKNIIKIERAIKNLTQDNLAKMIGVSRQTINAIELNKYVPSTLIALKIARIFQKKVDEIFMLEEFD
jgi:putative transcriptional regulator